MSGNTNRNKVRLKPSPATWGRSRCHGIAGVRGRGLWLRCKKPAQAWAERRRRARVGELMAPHVVWQSLSHRSLRLPWILRTVSREHSREHSREQLSLLPLGNFHSEAVTCEGRNRASSWSCYSHSLGLRQALLCGVLDSEAPKLWVSPRSLQLLAICTR